MRPTVQAFWAGVWSMRIPLMLFSLWLTLVLLTGCSAPQPAPCDCREQLVECQRKLEDYRRSIMVIYDELQARDIVNNTNFRRLWELEGAVEDHNGRLVFIESRVDQQLKELRYVGEGK